MFQNPLQFLGVFFIAIAAVKLIAGLIVRNKQNKNGGSDDA